MPTFLSPGGAFAVYSGAGLVQYNHPDWLGSAKLFSTPTRSAVTAMSYAPYGEGYAGGQQYVQFTSFGNDFTVQNNENQSGSLEDFTFRRYSPVQGRWISPDPAGLAAVDITNPQSWNRYAYVGNNPLNYVDPLGLWRYDCYSVEDGGHVCVWVPEAGDTPSPAQANASGGSGAANNGKLTPAQCKAAQTLLAREQKYGTTIAAWQSAIGYGDGTVEPFNSTNTAPINSPVGPIKVDWYTDLQLAGPFGDPLLYPVAKLTWTGVRLATGAPITNSFPFQDPAESNAWLQSQNPFSTFSSIFTPQFMAQNCSGGGG